MAHYVGAMATERFEFNTRMYFLSIALESTGAESGNESEAHRKGIDKYAGLRKKAFCVSDVLCICTFVLFIILLLMGWF